MTGHNRELFQTHNRDFLRIFNMSLSSFFSPIVGFDVIGFDDYLQVPDGTSTAEYVLENYGQEALDLLSNLI